MKTGGRGTGFRKLVNSYKHGAKRRGLVWALSDDEVASLTASPCTYCGTPPDSISSPDHTPWVYSGIDRVDNSQGYEASNVVPCCKCCNEMKMDTPVADFLKHVAAIYKASTCSQSLEMDHHG